MTPTAYKQLLADKGIVLNDRQMEQYHAYYRLLVEWNGRMNLTAITDEAGVYLKHFYDSLTLALYSNVLNEEVSLCDVGAGAGFPSIPLKIALPHLRVTIVDSLNKRITFLNEVVKELGLKNVTCCHDRAEDFGQKLAYREQFDVVTARAVARLNLLSEFCLPLVKQNGCFVAMKSVNIHDELEQAKKAFGVLGGQVDKVHSFDLPNDAGQRHIVTIKKVSSTPKQYPRKAGVPAKKPIE